MIAPSPHQIAPAASAPRGTAPGKEGVAEDSQDFFREVVEGWGRGKGAGGSQGDSKTVVKSREAVVRKLIEPLLTKPVREAGASVCRVAVVKTLNSVNLEN